MEEEQRQKYMKKRTVLPAEISAAIAKIRIAFASLHKDLKSQEEVIQRHLATDAILDHKLMSGMRQLLAILSLTCYT